MRNFLIPATLAVGLGLSGAAFAATTSTGTVKAVDVAKHMLTLDDGTVYMLPTKFKDPGLKPGEKVSVSWNMVKSDHEAKSVKIIK